MKACFQHGGSAATPASHRRDASSCSRIIPQCRSSSATCHCSANSFRHTRYACPQFKVSRIAGHFHRRCFSGENERGKSTSTTRSRVLLLPSKWSTEETSYPSGLPVQPSVQVKGARDQHVEGRSGKLVVSCLAWPGNGSSRVRRAWCATRRSRRECEPAPSTIPSSCNSLCRPKVWEVPTTRAP